MARREQSGAGAGLIRRVGHRLRPLLDGLNARSPASGGRMPGAVSWRKSGQLSANNLIAIALDAIEGILYHFRE